MENKKKQHYVPQLQLSQFAYDKKKEHIWILDKNQRSIRSGSIEDVCEENYFYKIPISKIFSELKPNSEDYNLLDESCLTDTGKHINELSKEELDKFDYSVENYFSDFVEPALSRYIDNIIKIATFNEKSKNNFGLRYFINEDDKHDFSWFIAKEYIRTKHHRDIMSNMMEKSYKKLIPIVAQIQGFNIDENDISIKYSKDQIKLLHASSIFDDKMCETFANVFFSSIWMLIENNTNEPFCCIDNTLMMYPTEKMPPFYGYGLATYGMTLYVPISPKYMLVMHERNKFKDRIILDKTIIVENNIKIIDQVNLELIHSSYKYVIFNKESAAKKYKAYGDKCPELYNEAPKGEVY